MRRRILTILYEHYQESPLDMLNPQDVLEDGTVPHDALKANIHYLGDRGLVGAWALRTEPAERTG